MKNGTSRQEDNGQELTSPIPATPNGTDSKRYRLIQNGKDSSKSTLIGPVSQAPSVVFLPIPTTEEDEDLLENDGFQQQDGRDRTISATFDPWELPEINLNEGTPWKELSKQEKTQTVFRVIGKALALLLLLYMFVCTLGLLSQAFRLLGGRAAGEVFRDSTLLHNPICGLMIGVLATVLLQSSSTSTSIVVSMVAANILTVRIAIPIVMGANIGTSMTNTLVSVAHSSKRAEFRRAFAGATVHDMFNWLSVIILLPLETAFGYLYSASDLIVRNIGVGNDHEKPPKLLKHITDPLTKLIIQLDKNKIKEIALGTISNATLGGDQDDQEEFSLIKRFCPPVKLLNPAYGTTNNGLSATTAEKQYCSHIFARSSLSDISVGLILLCVSLGCLVTCLIFIVKLLHSMLKGKIAAAIRKTINNDFPHPFGFLTGYAAILLGMILTILVQSSSVFTSALTPLVGIGVLSLERMYPLTLGANVGTTFTSVLAAIAAPPERLGATLQISLCHLFFNLSGILLFYPIPFTRKAPIALAKLLGNKTAKYRWVAVLYVAVMFFLLPAAIFGLSMAGSHVLMGVGIPFVTLFGLAVAVNVLQSKCPKALPNGMRSWSWLPKWMHSLEPLDRLFSRIGDQCCPFGGVSAACPCCPRLLSAEPDTSARPIPRASESRKQLLLSPSNGNTPAVNTPAPSTNPSRFHSRSSSPNRFFIGSASSNNNHNGGGRQRSAV